MRAKCNYRTVNVAHFSCAIYLFSHSLPCSVENLSSSQTWLYFLLHIFLCCCTVATYVRQLFACSHEAKRDLWEKKSCGNCTRFDSRISFCTVSILMSESWRNQETSAICFHAHAYIPPPSSTSQQTAKLWRENTKKHSFLFQFFIRILQSRKFLMLDNFERNCSNRKFELTVQFRSQHTTVHGEALRALKMERSCARVWGPHKDNP